MNRVWKGELPKEASITTGLGGGDCGIDFSKGLDYLVYAVESDFYGEQSLVSTICDRTNELSLLPGDLLELGEGQPPIEKSDPGRKIENNGFYFWGAIIGAFIIVAGFIFLKQKKGLNA